jgi:hypothetical protein
MHATSPNLLTLYLISLTQIQTMQCLLQAFLHWLQNQAPNSDINILVHWKFSQFTPLSHADREPCNLHAHNNRKLKTQIQMKTAPFRLLCRVYWKFLTDVSEQLIGPMLKGLKSKGWTLDSWPFKTGPTGCPATSVRNYQYTLCNSPEERSSHLLCARSLKCTIVLSNKSRNRQYWSARWKGTTKNKLFCTFVKNDAALICCLLRF